MRKIKNRTSDSPTFAIDSPSGGDHSHQISLSHYASSAHYSSSRQDENVPWPVIYFPPPIGLEHSITMIKRWSKMRASEYELTSQIFFSARRLAHSLRSCSIRPRATCNSSVTLPHSMSSRTFCSWRWLFLLLSSSISWL
jgi:hypothetical protein